MDVICVLPQRRRRVVLVASPTHDPREVLFRDGHPGIDEREPRPGDAVGFYWTEGRSGSGLRREAVPTLKVGSSIGLLSAPAVLLADGRLGTPTIQVAERLQGFPGDGRSRQKGWGEAHAGGSSGMRCRHLWRSGSHEALLRLGRSPRMSRLGRCILVDTGLMQHAASTERVWA